MFAIENIIDKSDNLICLVKTNDVLSRDHSMQNSPISRKPTEFQFMYDTNRDMLNLSMIPWIACCFDVCPRQASCEILKIIPARKDMES